MTQPLECRSHDWCFLRQQHCTFETPRDERSTYHTLEHYDVYYCSRCLKYNEVVTYRNKYVVDKYVPPTYKPPWEERLYAWWYNLTHKPNRSAKEAPTQQG